MNNNNAGESHIDNKFLIIAAIITACIIAIGVFFNIQFNKSIDSTKSILEDISVIPAVQVDSVNYHLNDTVLSVLEAKESSIIAVLNLQYSKIQAEYQTLSLWAGVLMVVFLIFSLYSFIRVEEMQKQSRQMLKVTEAASNEVKSKIASIDNDLQDAKKNLSSSTSDELKKMQSVFEEKKRELTDATLKSIDSIDKIIKDKDELLQKKINEVDERVNSSMSRVEKTLGSFKSIQEHIVNLAKEFYAEGSKDEGEGGSEHSNIAE